MVTTHNQIDKWVEPLTHEVPPEPERARGLPPVQDGPGPPQLAEEAGDI